MAISSSFEGTLPGGESPSAGTAHSLPATFSAQNNVSKKNETEIASQNAFWTHSEIDPANWNRVFPYEFRLVFNDGKNWQTEPDWTFTLPFPPESLSISMPFAITNSISQGGVIEEHGGAPIRMISLSGSLGVLPLRPTGPVKQTDSLATAIFAGTINKINQTVNGLNNVAGALGVRDPNSQPNLVPEGTSFSNDVTGVSKTSGYYQMRALQNYFENYAYFKTTSKGRKYRLAFCIHKRQEILLVTPQAFNVSQSAASPLEYLYNLSLKGWRRIDLTTSFKGKPIYVSPPRSPNKLASLLRAISAARSVMANARGVLAAVGGDLDHALFEPLRQTSLFLKDTLNTAISYSDLPISVLNSSKSTILNFMSTAQAFLGAGETIESENDQIRQAYQDMADAAEQLSQVTAGSGNLTQDASLEVEGLASTHQAFDMFRNPDDYYDLFDSIKPGQTTPPPQAIGAMQQERQKVRAFDRATFESFRDTVKGVQTDFEAAVGAGNTTFNKTYNKSNVIASKTPTDTDFQIIFALNDAAMALDALAVSNDISNTLSSVDFVAGLAARSGIAFTTPRSKFAVPVPYGSTLEQIAAQYLGEADRWFEIVALNGLRAPYVDERGFDMLLLTNGYGNQVQVADVSNLFIGQTIWLSSTFTARTSRHITVIDKVSDNNYTLTLDGDPDLARFSTIAGAVLHATLPGTINSTQTIYIPSQDDPADDLNTRQIPGIDVFDPLIEVAGIDLLLTSGLDLAITPDGDNPFAAGLTNIVQTVKIAFATPKGTLPRHAGFGFPLKPGMSTADISANDLLTVSKNMFQGDPSFAGVRGASVMKNGGSVSIAISMALRGVSNVIPITLNLK